MTLHFEAVLGRVGIEKIQEKGGFNDPYAVERFIMNFEIFRAVQKEIPDCAVRGGMAVPFHLASTMPARLSADIDVVTSLDRKGVIDAMHRVAENSSDGIRIPEHHKPERARVGLPLLTYFCEYETDFGGAGEVKMEIFYGGRPSVGTDVMEAPRKMTGFTIGYDLTVYRPGPLIGSKLTALAFETVGLPPEREYESVKHIYDIASLLKSAQGSEWMTEAAAALKQSVADEMSYRQDPGFATSDVINDLAAFPSRLLEVRGGRMRLSKSHEGRLGKFRAELLGNAKYADHDHAADILLAGCACLALVRRVSKKPVDESLLDVLAERAEIAALDGRAHTRRVRWIAARLGIDTEDGRIVKNMTAEQACLYSAAVRMGGRFLAQEP